MENSDSCFGNCETVNINYLSWVSTDQSWCPVPVSTKSRFIIAQLGINFTLFSCFCSAEVLSLSCHHATWRPPPCRGRAGFFLPDKKLIVSVHIICTEPGLCLCSALNMRIVWWRWIIEVYIKRASIRGQIGDVVEDRCCQKIDNYFTDCTFKIDLMCTTMRQLLFVIFAKYLQICDPDIFANIDITIYQTDIKSILWFMLHDKY